MHGKRSEKAEDRGAEAEVADCSGSRKALMTVSELAEWSKMSERTIRRWAAAEELGFPVLRFGREYRFDENDVKAWMRDQARAKDSWRLQDVATGEIKEEVLRPFLAKLVKGAPEEYRELARRVDTLILRVAKSYGMEVSETWKDGVSRLAYGVPIHFRGQSISSFAIVDVVAANPYKGMRARVLYPEANQNQLVPSDEWKLVAKGSSWIYTNLRPEMGLSDFRSRVIASLEYVLGRA